MSDWIHASLTQMEAALDVVKKMQTSEYDDTRQALNALIRVLKNSDSSEVSDFASDIKSLLKRFDKQFERLTAMGTELVSAAEAFEKVQENSKKAVDELEYAGKRSEFWASNIMGKVTSGVQTSLVMESKTEEIGKFVSDRIKDVFQGSALSNNAAGCTMLGAATLYAQKDVKNTVLEQVNKARDSLFSKGNIVGKSLEKNLVGENPLKKYISDPLVSKIDSAMEKKFGFTTGDLTSAVKGYFSDFDDKYQRDFKKYISDPVVETIDSAMEKTVGFTTGDLTKAAEEYFDDFGKNYAFYYCKYSAEPMGYWAESVMDLVSIAGKIDDPLEWYSLFTKDLPDFAEDFSAVGISYVGNILEDKSLKETAKKVSEYDGLGNLLVALDMRDGELGALGTTGIFMTESNTILDIISMAKGGADVYDFFTNSDKSDVLKMFTGLSTKDGSMDKNVSRINKWLYGTNKSIGTYIESDKTDEDHQDLLVGVAESFFKGTGIGSPFFKLNEMAESEGGLKPALDIIEENDPEFANKKTLGDIWINRHLDTFDEWYGKQVENVPEIFKQHK